MSPSNEPWPRESTVWPFLSRLNRVLQDNRLFVSYYLFTTNSPPHVVRLGCPCSVAGSIST